MSAPSGTDYVRMISECRRVVRMLADRQNSDSVLKASEASTIVNACLNAANVLEGELQKRGDLPPTAQAVGVS